ncbi:hypothetical protein [Promicromonospora sp. NPDC050880]|uniref:hypothetical protein n=1 Tax=Promicromonospora sp. NPDC050880 TaxID=3364406 RepID=UPI0037BCF14F
MADMRLGIEVDTDTRATRREFSDLRREVKREADGMGGDWEAAAAKVEDALREAGARDDLLEAARRIGEQGPTEIEKMRTALRDAGDAGKQAGDDVQDGLDGIKRAVEDNAIDADDLYKAEIKAELVSNFSEAGAEVVRGFKDGFDSEDIETITDALTDTLVAVGAVGGPAGIAGALVASTLIQSFVGQWQQSKEAVEAIGTEVRDILIENSTGSFDQLPAEAREAYQQVRAEALLTQYGVEAIETAAERLGVTAAEALAAMAGDTESTRIVSEAYSEAIEHAADNYGGPLTLDGQAALKMLRDQTSVVTDETGNLQDGISNAEREYDLLEGASRKFGREGVSSANKVDGAVRGIRGKDVDVDVDDRGTAGRTQREVDRIRGRDVPVNVYVPQSSINDVYNTVNGIRLPAIQVQVRLGQAAV